MRLLDYNLGFHRSYGVLQTFDAWTRRCIAYRDTLVWRQNGAVVADGKFHLLQRTILRLNMVSMMRVLIPRLYGPKKVYFVTVA